MSRENALATLRLHETELRARGILHVALFGSLARGERRPDSDIDILVDIDPDAVRDIYAYVDLKEFVAGLFEGPVDVVSREALKPSLRDSAVGDSLFAF
jgi:predicted nucleotidyltransferase